MVLQEMVMKYEWVQLLFGSANSYLQLTRFVVVFLIGIILIKAVVMPIIHRLAGRRGADKKTKHTLENIIGVVGVFAVFVAALQAGDFGNLVTVIGAIAGAATLSIGWGMRDQVSSIVSGVFLHVYPPFVKGDYIAVGDVTGTVKASTLVETTLRSNTGEKIVLPNSYLTSRPMTNQTKGTVTQDSIRLTITPEKLEMAEQELKRLADEYDEVLNTPPPRVMHTDISDSAIETELIYYLRDNQDIRQIRSNVIQQFTAVAVEKSLLTDPPEETGTAEPVDTR